jgi:hypothetical protein
MPGLTIIKILADVTFFSHSKKLGTQTEGYTKKYSDKQRREMRKEDLVAVPSTIPPWFMPNEIPNYYHQEACDKIGKEFKDFAYAMLDAVSYSHNMWKLQAKFKDLKVNALTALGTPGCLDGPELESNIKNAPMCASFSGNKAKHRDAVAKGVSKCFKDWQSKVMVPGLPWYPAFVAFPAPQAPPMPNIPVPLITCPSAMMTKIIMPNDMKSEMDSALDGGLKDKDKDKQYEALHDAIATPLSIAFVIWLASQMVMLVMGKGPIPSFAPPFVPVGPVVMGDNIAAPGHLMA